MFKKMTVLAMAVGVVAAFALPASASAVWKHHSTAIQQDVQLGLTGQARFQAPLGGVECQVTSRVKFTTGTTTGHAETFTPHPGTAPDNASTERCKGTGGLAFCQIHDVTALNLSYEFHTANYQTTQLTTIQHQNPPSKTIITHANGTTHNNVIVITTKEITSQATGAFCPVTHINLTGGTVAAIGEGGPNTVSKVNLTGTLRADLTTNSGTKDEDDAEVQGQLQIEDPLQRATYSI